MSKTKQTTSVRTGIRRRLVWITGNFVVTFLLCFLFARVLYDILTLPFQWVTQAADNNQQAELVFTSPQEFFLTQLKISLFFGTLLTIPFIFTQAYKVFAQSGPGENHTAMYPYLTASQLLFILGIAVTYFFILPHNLSLLINPFQVDPNTGYMFSVSHYLDYTIYLFVVSLTLFQLPVAVALFVRSKLATPNLVGR